MSRDRLAAARARRAQTMEMSNLATTGPANAGGSSSPFLSEATNIQEGIRHYNENVSRISILRSQMLNEPNAEESEQLDSLAEENRTLSQDLRERIQRLAQQPQEQDAELRRTRIALLQSKFMEAIQNYQLIEKENRAKSRQRVERQLKIVKPDATPEEVAAAFEGGGEQIFAQALTTSTRYGESRAAYREVQGRQEDLRKMEQTLAELAQLFNDMGTLIEQQEAVITAVEDTARDVEANTEKALQHTGQAVVHARSYRKGRWICFFIFLFVVCVLALVLGIVFGTRK
ncbi:syntaxin-like protein [Laccaria bicolor S238N-H82]|uniref:Syntaxin-like protein n=1 Tax=Laccaria bicolor (strain S238N-H82 / ATCC MYA-4686) TaxID=486041 RepID=B0CS84_LACBS|nr:syntaxin-like protein [Laccaria bicolor S238N-H82]EDR14260.1 syntaxin-like protein [Laccaria bicolor S238N-H82]|eukprot:XP_001874819.1 syntaxin-like protein [Laccaria bicolor S238N-H82]